MNNVQKKIDDEKAGDMNCVNGASVQDIKTVGGIGEQGTDRTTAGWLWERMDREPRLLAFVINPPRGFGGGKVQTL